MLRQYVLLTPGLAEGFPCASWAKYLPSVFAFTKIHTGYQTHPLWWWFFCHLDGKKTLWFGGCFIPVIEHKARDPPLHNVVLIEKSFLL